MRIEQTADGRYVKVLSPELKGLIGRVYQEIRERKESDEAQNDTLSLQGNAISLVQSKLDMLLLRYSDLSGILDTLFPSDEDSAVIDRPLLVTKTVTALQFISEIVTGPPLIVASSMLVENLNAEFLGGKSATDFAPMEHVGAGGAAAHMDATQSVSGFLGTMDKQKLDKLTISKNEPVTKQPDHIWFDLN